MKRTLLLVVDLFVVVSVMAQTPEEMYRKGDAAYDKREYAEAVRWLQPAAEAGNADAQYLLGWCYKDGNGVASDDSNAAQWWNKAYSQFNLLAEGGDAHVQYRLGLCYHFGCGTLMDAHKAADWYRKAAEQGYAAAQCNMGIAYYNGIGVAQDFSQAANWFCKAAKQGDAAAQCNLGICYNNGIGVAQDFSQAAFWYRKAAERGNAVAQRNLGDAYYYGNGLQRDPKQAEYWYLLAAKQGYGPAMAQLGYIYQADWQLDLMFGASDEQIEFWYRKAAEKGETYAYGWLGFRAYNRKDYSEAVGWWQKAIDGGRTHFSDVYGMCDEFSLSQWIDIAHFRAKNDAVYTEIISAELVSGDYCLLEVTKDNRKGIVGIKGTEIKTILPVEFEYIYSVSGKVLSTLVAKKNGQKALYSAGGTEIIASGVYDDLDNTGPSLCTEEYQLIKVDKDGRCGYVGVDKNGRIKEVIPIKYAECYDMSVREKESGDYIESLIEVRDVESDVYRVFMCSGKQLCQAPDSFNRYVEYDKYKDCYIFHYGDDHVLVVEKPQ